MISELKQVIQIAQSLFLSEQIVLLTVLSSIIQKAHEQDQQSPLLE